MHVPDGKKSLERNALDSFLKDSRNMKGYTIEEGERPDFILIKNGHRIGVEHFRADTILNQHTDSESMKYDGERKAIFKKHNKALLNDEFDAISSANDIEISINKSLDAVSKFDYEVFINNLNEVLEQHAGRVSAYKKKCDEVWFLIDIGIENNYFTGLLDNGGETKISMLPVTGDMLSIFGKHKDVSRVIVCSRCLGKYKLIYDSGGKKYGYRFRAFTYTEALFPVSRQIKLNVKNTGKEDEP